MLNLNKNKFFFFYKDSSCVKIHPNSLEHGYLLLLNDDLGSANKIFSSLDSSRAIWASILVSILQGYLKNNPTYFQIRNFLEIDLDLLVKNEKITYIEQFLGSLEFLLPVNVEVYKYVSRVFLYNNLGTLALKYMNKSKKVYYNDAELHFLLSKYYFQVNDFDKSMYYINECLRLIPDYYPAIVMHHNIEGSMC